MSFQMPSYEPPKKPRKLSIWMNMENPEDMELAEFVRGEARKRNISEARIIKAMMRFALEDYKKNGEQDG